MAGTPLVDGTERTGRTRRSPLLWATIAAGGTAGVLVIVPIATMALRFADRHFILPDGIWGIWDFVEGIADTTAFTMLYLVGPVGWVILGITWWRRPSAHRPTAKGPLRWILLLAGLFGAWGWFVTMLRQLWWTFDLDWIPMQLITFALKDTDRWDLLVIASLTCLLFVVGVCIAMMITQEDE